MANDKRSDREKVKEKWRSAEPSEALLQDAEQLGWAIISRDKDDVILILGSGVTKDDAWHDAAARI